tara:strand:+ start:1680 stop:2084 length:405 start_codon:yes stop_codon:yes gene_type:complete
MKRDELIDHALHLYRSGIKVTKIAESCQVNRRTIHRWINESGASREDYIEEQKERERRIRERAEQEQTLIDQINYYRHNMLWEMLISYLPNAQIRNITDMVKVYKVVREFGNPDEINQISKRTLDIYAAGILES